MMCRQGQCQRGFPESSMKVHAFNEEHWTPCCSNHPPMWSQLQTSNRYRPSNCRCTTRPCPRCPKSCQLSSGRPLPLSPLPLLLPTFALPALPLSPFPFPPFPLSLPGLLPTLFRVCESPVQQRGDDRPPSCEFRVATPATPAALTRRFLAASRSNCC